MLSFLYSFFSVLILSTSIAIHAWLLIKQIWSSVIIFIIHYIILYIMFVVFSKHVLVVLICRNSHMSDAAIFSTWTTIFFIKILFYRNLFGFIHLAYEFLLLRLFLLKLIFSTGIPLMHGNLLIPWTILLYSDYIITSFLSSLFWSSVIYLFTRQLYVKLSSLSWECPLILFSVFE